MIPLLRQFTLETNFYDGVCDRKRDSNFNDVLISHSQIKSYILTYKKIMYWLILWHTAIMIAPVDGYTYN